MCSVLWSLLVLLFGGLGLGGVGFLGLVVLVTGVWDWVVSDVWSLGRWGLGGLMYGGLVVLWCNGFGLLLFPGLLVLFCVWLLAVCGFNVVEFGVFRVCVLVCGVGICCGC